MPDAELDLARREEGALVLGLQGAWRLAAALRAAAARPGPTEGPSQGG